MNIRMLCPLHICHQIIKCSSYNDINYTYIIKSTLSHYIKFLDIFITARK